MCRVLQDSDSQESVRACGAANAVQFETYHWHFRLQMLPGALLTHVCAFCSR